MIRGEGKRGEVRGKDNGEEKESERTVSVGEGRVR